MYASKEPKESITFLVEMTKEEAEFICNSLFDSKSSQIDLSNEWHTMVCIKIFHHSHSVSEVADGPSDFDG